MIDDLNPQYEQMAHESMVRNLAHQAEAIWPQEAPLFRAYDGPAIARILDVGCGTGEISSRLAELFPSAAVLGVDIIDSHLELARIRYKGFGDRLRFEHRDAFELGLADASCDLTVCRHMLQAVPHPERVLAELVRVTRRGGRLHLIAEDYGMIHMAPTRLPNHDFWHEAPYAFGGATGTDLHIGRNAYSLLRALPLRDIAVHYVVVDTVRVARETMAGIFEAWRDGYAEPVAQHSRLTLDQALAHFDDMIACIRSPDGYAVWQVPVWSAVVE